MSLDDLAMSQQLRDFIGGGIDHNVLVQSTVSRAFRGNPRKRAFIEEWMGDSPYVRAKGSKTPEVFFHVDRQTDPFTSMNEGRFIQTEGDPNELGLHSGSNAAAIGATIKNADIGAQQMHSFDTLVDEFAGFTDDPASLKSLIVRTVDDWAERRFARGEKPTNNVFEELEAELDQVLLEVGAPTGFKGMLIRQLKGLPTANTTPHLFRGKNGLFLEDRGGWFKQGVKAQLHEVFGHNSDEFDVIESLGTWKQYQDYIESKGYDHVIYHNTVEDRGSISIINWNEDLMLPLYDKRLHFGDKNHNAALISGMVLGAMGIGDAEVR
jgi:hypothetical protein